jgi:predicted Na+-dependent transporter
MFQILETIMKVISWFRIVLSPLFIGLAIGAFVYLPNPTNTRLAIGITIISLSLIIGIVWATRVWNSKEGTIWFVSRISATPDLDKNQKDENKN